jgi:hypothetical protein
MDMNIDIVGAMSPRSLIQIRIRPGPPSSFGQFGQRAFVRAAEGRSDLTSS